MAMSKRVWHKVLEDLGGCTVFSRFYCSKVDLRKLRPMILKRIQDRQQEYPVKIMTPVAQEVLQARNKLIQGVSTLLKVFPVVACKFCHEVYIGEEGHMIKTCHGFKRQAKNQVHIWRSGSINDILVQVEAFHLPRISQNIIKHNQRFDFDRVPAIIELCTQAGATLTDKNSKLEKNENMDFYGNVNDLSPQDLWFIGKETVNAWETVRSGVEQLLLVYSAKVCKYCSEVHVGSSGHKARLCGVFKFESWKGTHFWKKARVDDFVPPRIVWRRRPQDPPVLLDEGRGFYGHAPAVVDLCTKTGAVVPCKYDCMMKVQGLRAHILSNSETVC